MTNNTLTRNNETKEYMTPVEFAQAVNHSVSSVRKWIYQYNLPVIEDVSQPPTIDGRQFYLVEVDGFWDWVRENRKHMQIRKAVSGTLDAPDWAIRAARRDGTRDNHAKRWTPEEDRLLKDYLDDVSVEVAAKKLNRTYSAVIRRMQRLNLYHMTERRADYTPSQVAEALGMNQTTVIRWINNDGLVSSQIYKRKSGDRSKRRHSIKGENLWKFLEGRKELIDMTRLKRGVIEPEPEWLDELETQTYSRRKEWTTLEERTIIRMLVEENRTRKDVSEALNRSSHSINRRIQRMHHEGRWPGQFSKKNPWLPEYEPRARAMRELGMSYRSIGEALGVSKYSVQKYLKALQV